jgi:hypothetical protein
LNKTRKSRRKEKSVFFGSNGSKRKSGSVFIHYSFIYFIQLKNQRKRKRENLLVIVECEKREIEIYIKKKEC